VADELIDDAAGPRLAVVAPRSQSEEARGRQRTAWLDYNRRIRSDQSLQREALGAALAVGAPTQVDVVTVGPVHVAAVIAAQGVTFGSQSMRHGLAQGPPQVGVGVGAGREREVSKLAARCAERHPERNRRLQGGRRPERVVGFATSVDSPVKQQD
jgi:hypothetical protein